MSSLVFYHHAAQKNPAIDLLFNAIVSSGKHSITPCFDEFRVDVYALTDQAASRTIAIDFDNTVTADADFYIKLIKSYRRQGWHPIICTLRDKDEENIAEIKSVLYGADVEIYTCGGKLKRQTLLSQGIQVNLWLDDFFPAICPCDYTLLKNNGIYL